MMHYRRGLLSAGVIACSILCLASTSPVAAQSIDFRDKTVTMIIGSAPGGGTDAVGRIVANYLGKHLPGQPSIVVRNMPGADGITALNFVVEQTKPDGLTVVTGAGPQVDPMTYRKANARYNPSELQIIGGIGRGGSTLLISKDGLARLHDKSTAPVVMGSNPGMPRNAMQITLWGIDYLGWNAKWVVGYRGTNDLMLALERGEIDMTATGNMFLIDKLVKTGNFAVLLQTGDIAGGATARRPEFAQVPTLSEQVAGKITDPIAQKAFTYWESINSMDKWIGMAPGTPDSVLAVYTKAYDAVLKDPEFVAKGKAFSEDFTPMTAADVKVLIHNLVTTPQEALDFTTKLMRKQGLRGS
jgi:tripartite-type tricarboxylate transporter receptor subunit TctC